MGQFGSTGWQTWEALIPLSRFFPNHPTVGRLKVLHRSLPLHPWNCEYVGIRREGDFGWQVELILLISWPCDGACRPDCPGGANIITGAYIGWKRKAEKERSREVARWSGLDLLLLVLKMEEESQGSGFASRASRGKNAVSTPDLPGKTVRLVANFWPLKL